MIENNTELLRLFKEIPVGMTDKVTYAVMPVLKLSTYLRDNVIMILRKELMSKYVVFKNQKCINDFNSIPCFIYLNILH